MKTLLINAPGAGDWIMAVAGGKFAPGLDHSFSNHLFPDGSEPPGPTPPCLGGFVLSTYLGTAMTVHMAGLDPRWCSRDLLWMVFHYGFVQLGCKKLIAPVRSDNISAIGLDIRAGWRLEGRIANVYDNADLLILTMEKPDCRWLRIKPRTYRPGPDHG